MARKILHLADLHIGSRHEYLDTDAELRAREVDTVLDRTADWLLGSGRAQVGAVLIAGDLFDNHHLEGRIVERVVRALDRISQAGIKVVTLPGNHDEWTYTDGVFRRYSSSWPGILVTNPEPERVTILDLDGSPVEIVTCAFQQGRNPPPDRWRNPLSGTRDDAIRRVGLFHGTLDRFGGVVVEGPRAFPLRFEQLAGWGLDYLALGHIHRRCEFRHGSCLAHYPGPIEGKSVGDPGSPQMTLVDLSGATPNIETIDARALGIRARDIGVLEVDLVRTPDLESLEKRILESADPDRPPPILRVEPNGRADFDWSPEETRRRLLARFLHLEIAPREASAGLGDWERLATQRTLEGLFVRKVLAKREEAASEEDRRIWEKVAEAGLRALGRNRG